MAAIVRTVDFDASIECAFDAVADFETYPSFLEGMKKVSVLSRDGNRLVVEFTLDLFKRIVYVLDVALKRPTGISWTLNRADMMKRNDGGWKFTAGDGVTHAEYTIDIDFKIWVPGPIADFLVNTSIPSTLKSFKKQVEKRARAAGASSTSGRTT